MAPLLQVRGFWYRFAFAPTVWRRCKVLKLQAITGELRLCFRGAKYYRGREQCRRFRGYLVAL